MSRPTPNIGEQTVRIAALGDMMLGDSPTTVGIGLHSRYPAESLPSLLGLLSPSIATADLVFANLECSLTSIGVGHTRRAQDQMRAEPAAAAAIRGAGVSVVSVANNHAMQHGAEGFRSTTGALEAAGIACVGLRGSQGWCSEPAVMSVRGADVGFLGYCLRPRQYGSSEPLYAEGNLPAIIADIERLRARVSYTVVSLHWGEEFLDNPSEQEVAFARALVDAGCSLVIGHHPHVLRPIERYGRGVIAYSLGNAITDMLWQENLRTGAVLHCDLAPEYLRAEVQEIRANDCYRPVVTGRRNVTNAAVIGVPLGVYQKAAVRSVQVQRLRSYLYTLRNARHFPPAVLVELGVTTLLNKIRRLLPQRAR